MKKLYVTTSWDDGHKLDLKLSRLLQKYNLQGTFYISPYNNEFSEVELLSPNDVKHISETHDIGAHTLNHLNLCSLSLDNAKKEIEESKSFLDKLLNKDTAMFCYPMGRYNLKIIELVKAAGFIGSRTTERFHSDFKDRYRVGTSLQVYTHFSDIFRILKFYEFNLIETIRNYSWRNVAKKYFDDLLEGGGIFHIWGHSWEIEKHQDWKKLEELFEYISHRKGVEYLTNSDLVKYKYA